MKLFQCMAAAGIVLACMATPLAAQEPEDKLAALRTKDALTDEDRGEIRRVVDGLVADVAGNDATASQHALTQLRDGPKGARDFSDAYVAAYLAAAGSAYKKAPAGPAARLITVLPVYNDARSFNVLLEAMQDDRAAVRAAAAIALRALRTKAAADAGTYNGALGALRDAGKKETAREVLQVIYRAMSFSDVPGADPRAGVTAVLDLLEARVQQLAGEKVHAEGADYVGLQTAGALRKSMDDAERKRYTIVLAKMLHYGVRVYTASNPPLSKVRDKTSGPDAVALRDATELLITDAEQQLKDLLSPSEAPQVAAQMQHAKYVDMVNEMNKWVDVLKEKAGLDLSALTPPPPSEEEGGGKGKGKGKDEPGKKKDEPGKKSEGPGIKP
jgi:hypothetical protein